MPGEQAAGYPAAAATNPSGTPSSKTAFHEVGGGLTDYANAGSRALALDARYFLDFSIPRFLSGVSTNR